MKILTENRYSQFVVWDYYDGEKEGLVRSPTDNAAFYFKMVWWDEGQNWRLYKFFEIEPEEFWRSVPDASLRDPGTEPFYISNATAVDQKFMSGAGERRVAHYVFGKGLRGEVALFDADDS